MSHEASSGHYHLLSFCRGLYIFFIQEFDLKHWFKKYISVGFLAYMHAVYVLNYCCKDYFH